MYNPPSVHRPSDAEEEDRRRDTRAGSQQHRQPPLHPSPYNSHSPSMISHHQQQQQQQPPPPANPHHHAYSPSTNGTIPPLSQPYTPTYSSRPSSSSNMQTNVGVSPGRYPTHSPTNGFAQPARGAYSPREVSKSTYYDPTSEHRDNSSTWNAPTYNRSPVQHRDLSNYYDVKTDAISRSNHKSPTTPHFSRRDSRDHQVSDLNSHSSVRSETNSNNLNGPSSPRHPKSQSSISHIVNGNGNWPTETIVKYETKPVETRRADPMSFSNILSNNIIEPAAKPVVKVEQVPPPAETNHIISQPVKVEPTPKVRSVEKSANPTNSSRKIARKSSPSSEAASKSASRSTSRSKPRAIVTSSKKLTITLEKEIPRIKETTFDVEKVVSSDMEVDGPEWIIAKDNHARRSLKRLRDIEEDENKRRKIRRKQAFNNFLQGFDRCIESGREAYRQKHGNEVAAEVQQREVLDEKERKKDMQRKRRRERTILNETQKQRELIEKAHAAEDDEERGRLLREAHKAEKKAKITKRVLDYGEEADDIESNPIALNLEGGTTGTLSFDNETPEPSSKKPKKVSSSRSKKSKEKKQAEKDAAEQGYAELLQRDELPQLAPKVSEDSPIEFPAPDGNKSKGKEKKEQAITITPGQVSGTKAYWTMYEQILKDIARKEIPKVHKIKCYTEDIKAQNAKKTATLAAKEAKRFQMKTNKGTKDGSARLKRSIRETATFWKRNERVEKERAKLALKEETERLKKQAAEKEAARQKRKLEFLISQTELYSFFVNKEKGAESTADATGKVAANFEEVDFDDEDGTARHQAAMASAEAAYKKAQEGREELDFQNPTSLDEEDVPQPKMLACQLKEYQLKGLNWLRGLFVKGINGILADEMGLGKTVQSISILAWLAEVQNIWGPFLVVAPASTLHNWEQELVKFLPDFNVLPYWGTQRDRKVLRKCWDRKHKTYSRDTPFNVMVTSYEIVVRDPSFFQKQEWKYMILDEAQAIKSSQSARWQTLLKVKSDGRVLLTGTPIQNNMQELWALLHFIMPDLFDSHDEFSEWFSKDIESHTATHSKLDEEQLKRLHMVLKPFMLRRIKKDVQKELGEKIEIDIACSLSYRQRAAYISLRDKVKLWDLMKNGLENGEAADTLMNLVVQLRKLCNHPNLFSRAETSSPFAFASFAATGSFIREGKEIECAYSTRNRIDYELPRLLCGSNGRLSTPGPSNPNYGFEKLYLGNLMNIWNTEYIRNNSQLNASFSWLRFSSTSPQEAVRAARDGLFDRAVDLSSSPPSCLGRFKAIYDDGEDVGFNNVHSMFNIVDRNDRQPLAELGIDGHMKNLFNVSRTSFSKSGLGVIEACAIPKAQAPPVHISCSNQDTEAERKQILFNINVRKALYQPTVKDEMALLRSGIKQQCWPVSELLPTPMSEKSRYTHITVPSMRRFVTDSGKLAKLDALLHELRRDDHRILLYFQMTRMMDLMEEYLTYRNYKYLRLDGSTSIENRRDRVQEFQSNPEIFVFLLSTRAGGLGINLTAADTVIFYDSDWNPTIDAQAMDRAHRLGQTRQVTVYRMITLGTVEERIRKRALQKQEVQQLVITGEASGGIDFNARDKDTRAKDYAMFLAEDDQEMELIERREAEIAEKAEREKKKMSNRSKKSGTNSKKKEVSLDEMYHEGEGYFDDPSAKPSAVGTPMDSDAGASTTAQNPPPRGGRSRKAKTTKQRLAIIDGSGEP